MGRVFPPFQRGVHRCVGPPDENKIRSANDLFFLLNDQSLGFTGCLQAVFPVVKNIAP